MKTIIHPSNENFVVPKALTGKEFVAYASKKERPDQKSSYCILSRLEGGTKEKPGKFGFINVNYTSTSASFVSDTIEETVTRASKSREVRVFDSMEEMFTAIINKAF
jgi:hypothetical protein